MGTIDGRPSILLNQNLLLTAQELRQTFSHEFRHYWQRINKDKYNIAYWVCWANEHPEFGNDAYLFSPTELDSNRFAYSYGALDDFAVFESCKPCSKAYEELQENQRFASKLARNEGIHLLSTDTLQRLVNHSLLDDRAYDHWLRSRFEKSQLT